MVQILPNLELFFLVLRLVTPPGHNHCYQIQLKIGTLWFVLWEVHVDTQLQSSTFEMGKNRKCISLRHEMNSSLIATRSFVQNEIPL